MNVASRCIAFGEEKGFFPVLIDGDIDNDDGMTKKFAISVLRKEVIEAYLSCLKLCCLFSGISLFCSAVLRLLHLAQHSLPAPCRDQSISAR